MSLIERLDSIIGEEIASGDLAGSAICIVKDDREVLRRAYGVLDIDTGAPMPDEPIFRMYSMSKPITSAAAMILLERGVISLDDPVSRYLEGFRNQQVWQDGQLVPAERDVTVNDLLNMTSGLTYPDMATEPGRRMDALFEQAIARAKAGNGYSTVELCNLIGQQPLVFQPGTRWQYGTSADVLGAVIEVASGMAFGDFLRKELFEPLGMADTDFYVPAEKRGRFATMYQWHADEPKLRPYPGSHLVILDFTQPPAFQSGGAGLASTLSDYSRFARMLMNGGELDGKRILKPETVAFMHSDRLTAQQKPFYNWEALRGFTYGNLMRLLDDAGNIDPQLCGVGHVGEFGWDGWAGTYFMADPENRMIVLYYISRIDRDSHPMRAQIKRAIYDELV
ncbi:MAG: serine hydrolase domain-containing protein [Candidatus Fimadaptatus sp.]